MFLLTWACNKTKPNHLKKILGKRSSDRILNPGDERCAWLGRLASEPGSSSVALTGCPHRHGGREGVDENVQVRGEPDQYFFVAYAKRAFRTSFRRQKWPFKCCSNAKTVQYFFGVWDLFDAYTSEPQTSLERPKNLVSFVILIGNLRNDLQIKKCL